jgi:hypothetical protein
VKQHETPPVDDALVAAVARDADVDERSVIRRLAGLPVRGRAGRRIDRALQAREIAQIEGERRMTRPTRTRSTAALAVAPATVTDRTAPLVLGLEPRAYRELVSRLHVPHARIGRRVVARVDDVLAAFDRIARADGAVEPEAPAADFDTADDVLRRLGRRRAG